MSTPGLKRLIESLAGETSLPIEIDRIREQIIALGHQDRIEIRPGDADPGRLRGLFYQHDQSTGVYSIPDRCTLIVYNRGLSVDWARLVCAKELVHIFDDEIERTDTKEEIDLLISKILGPMSNDDVGVADLMALTDRFALYQSLPLLLPLASRDVARDLISSGRATVESVAQRVCIPVLYCSLVLSDDWPNIYKLVLDC